MSEPSSRVSATDSARQIRSSGPRRKSEVPSIWWRFMAASLIAMMVTSFIWALGPEGDTGGTQAIAAKVGIVQIAKTERPRP